MEMSFMTTVEPKRVAAYNRPSTRLNRSFRHPEVAAKRPSKDTAEAPGPSPFEARFASHLRVTDQTPKAQFLSYFQRFATPCAIRNRPHIKCAQATLWMRI
jgi:hypothetical protein